MRVCCGLVNCTLKAVVYTPVFSELMLNVGLLVKIAFSYGFDQVDSIEKVLTTALTTVSYSKSGH